ncbi:flagellar protein FliT [Noviherbaspirillum humi]|uniref:Flagellar protein FliT n=1 Tax=Noviherbaspirillum humi TaxID=1688639 RepID=A0A239FY72_9BURK|nr:flagellar protein FliT [Noviherbaspirillum humi]SNS61705.1 flagellar protein FliT [Noviherbaspirillum humi]
MECDEIIGLYEHVAALTDQMLAAARSGEWDELTALESDCARQVEMLRKAQPPGPLPPEAREQKVRILQKILADDREIRSLTETWMNRLSELMNSTGTERKLASAYSQTG